MSSLIACTETTLSTIFCRHWRLAARGAGPVPVRFALPSHLCERPLRRARLWLRRRRQPHVAARRQHLRRRRHAYDAAGNVTRITRPDGSLLAYGYDTANRLVRVSDAFDERIDYTLDAMGGRTLEQIHTSGGTALAKTQS